VQLDATGRWLFFANYSSGSAGVYPVRADGSLGEMADYVVHTGSGPNPERQTKPYAHSATVTPDNRYVIIADLGIDQLVVYAFDQNTGRMRKTGGGRSHPGAGPRHATFHQNGKYLYVANELDSTVSLYDYNAAQGVFEERQHLSTLPPDSPASTVADIHISPDGRHVYVSNRGYDSLAVFAVGADGSLASIAVQPCGGRTPRNFALAPGGRFVLVANQDSGEIAVLPRDPSAGTLDAPIGRAALPGANCIKFIPA
jgi:6-phosphogluconolactonase